MTTGILKMGSFVLLAGLCALGAGCAAHSHGGGDDGSSPPDGAGGSQPTGAGGAPQTGAGGAPQTGASGSSGTTGGSGSGGPQLAVQSVTSGGSACPDPANVDVAIDPNGEAIHLVYSLARLAIPMGAPIQHASCTTAFSVRGVPGWQFAAAELQAKGEVKLAARTEAEVSLLSFFAGNPAGIAARERWNGPVDSAFVVSKSFGDPEIVRSACGADTIFTVDTSVTLKAAANPQGGQWIEVQKLDVPIVWQKCE